MRRDWCDWWWLAVLGIVAVALSIAGCDPCGDGTCCGAEPAKVEQSPTITQPGVQLPNGARFGEGADVVMGGRQYPLHPSPSYPSNPVVQPDQRVSAKAYYMTRWLAEVPDDDRDAVYVSVFFNTAGPRSVELLKDAKSDPMLSQLVQWANTNWYDAQTTAGMRRMTAWNVQMTPTVIVHTSEYARSLPKSKVICMDTIYNGDGEALADRICTSISSVIQAFDYRRYTIPEYRPQDADQQQPQPYYPQPQPNYPQPAYPTAPTLPDWLKPQPQPSRPLIQPSPRQSTWQVTSFGLIAAFVLTVGVLMVRAKYKRAKKAR